MEDGAKRAVEFVSLVGGAVFIWLAVWRQLDPEADFRRAYEAARERLADRLRFEEEWIETELEIRGLPEVEE